MIEEIEKKIAFLKGQILSLLDRENDIIVGISKGNKERMKITLELIVMERNLSTLQNHSPIVVLDHFNDASKKTKQLKDRKKILEEAIEKLKKALENIQELIEKKQKELISLRKIANSQRQVIFVDFQNRKRIHGP
jgi:chromosome segregation ATPase